MKKLSIILASISLLVTLSLGYGSGNIELIVKYKPDAESTSNLTAQSDYHIKEKLSNNTYILSLENSAYKDMALAPLVSMKEQAEINAYKLASEFMKKHPEVIYAIPKNSTMKAYTEVNNSHTMNVTRWDDQWDMHNDGIGVGADGAWQLVNQAKEAIYTAVVDSGIAKNAPFDIQQNLYMDTTYYFYMNNQSVAISDNIYDNGSFHGTHVAGTIAANGPNVTGVIGSVSAIKVTPVRVLGDDGSGGTYSIMDGVKWAAGDKLNIANIKDNPHPAKVLNLSLGMSKPWYVSDSAWQYYYMPSLCSAWQDTINTVNKMNATVVLAAGNDSRTLFYSIPSGCPDINAIVVEASGPTGALSFYSTYNDPYSWPVKSLVVRAPGGDDKIYGEKGKILSTVNGDYGYMQGTSMAAPHVAGIVSLIYALNPDANVDYVRKILQLSVQENGVISAQKALKNTILLENSAITSPT
ncbi:S8 family serine peptidase [Fangia hongkongensis]|uniref:S8 family serine peptidase n=1 Tax=Fangia hongkongensis TaxID=270495 RepID=UPI00036ACF0E|nr:S8 family serine peptidase [Fangia hongkongensis]MBK2124708.1 S8 family serine peptidase [Fangia hongkongensis]